ncbi:MAG TPA: hypothetical protein VGY54_25880, partial [Polyangiaceae bacterium]|nr:hypothetical protein [Polyangiaceae bacterium]
MGLVLLAAFGLVLGAIVYLNTPAARRLVAQFVNDALAPSFQGRIQIERLGGLGLGGVSGADVTIYDPYGRRVLVVRGARVRIATLSTALSAVFGKRVPLTVQLPEVSVDRLEANLDSDSIGRLYLVNAFAPTRPSSPPDPNARGLRLVVSRITLKHGWVHGHMAGAPPLDVDLDGFQGALVFAPDVLEGEVSRVTIAARRILNGADVGGSLNARVRKPSDPKAVPSGHIDWQGSAAGASHQVRASLQDEKIHAVVDFPRIDPENVRLLWADSSVDVPASVHVEGHGTLSSVDVALHARLGKAAFDATGNLSSGDEKRATLSLSATEVDVHELVSSAPQSSLGLTGNVVAAMNRDGDATGEVKLDFGGGRVGNIGVPAASIVASGSRSAPNRVRADAEVVVEEPTLPTRLVTKVRPKGDSSTVDFELASRVPDFGRVPQFGGALHGNASLSARGSLDVATTTIDAELRASAADLVQGRTRLQAASVVAHANGVVNSPAIDVAANVRGVEVAGVHLSAASVHATGAATAPHIEASAQGPDVPAVDASADVGLTGGVALRNLRVALARAGEHAVIAARSIGLAGGDVRVNEVRLDGVGAPMTADVALGGGRLGVRASTDGIDLGRVARIAHIEDRLNSGTLAFDLDMSLGQGRGSGQAILNVTDVATGNVSGLSAQLQGTVVGRRIAGTVSAQAAGVGSIRLDIRKLELGGSDAVSAASWRRAWGYVGIEGRADLARVAALWPTGKFPLAEAQGEVAIDGHVARDDVRDLTPDVTLNLNTNRLDVAPKTFATTDIDGVLVVAQPPWRLAGIDFDVTATVNGDSGLLQLSAAARDAKGALGQVDATAPRVPFGDFFHDTGRASSELQKMPVDIRLSVPERGLGSLPPILRQSYVT